ncbi:MAG: glycosyltransferase [Candidatus Nanoarchaeia archaeon]
MVEFLTVVYLIYIFLSLYFLSLYILLYLPNKKKFFDFPEPLKEYSLDMIVPCHNAEKRIEKTIRTILESDYKGLRKVIVVDDCSTDNSFQVIKELAKKNHKILAVQTPHNTGNAAGSKNYGARFATAELIGFSDDDSSPERTAISKMVGFFNEEKTGAVTSSVLVLNNKNIIERLQAIEYRMIVFTRKLLGFADAIYVTPGPLAIYKKEVFDKIGGFDEKNLTEDIEITWNMISKGYNVRMSSQSKVYTEVPSNIKVWFKQRLRWNIGGVQTIQKYRKTFLKKGMLGSFIIPFFILSWIIGISGLLILFYRITQSIIISTLSASYSIKTQAAILSLSEINLVPSILIIFGILILVVGFIFTLTALYYTREDRADFKKVGVFGILGYSFLYLLAYPILLVISVYKIISRKEHSW